MLATEPPIALSQRASVRPGETRRVAISQSNYIPWKGYFDFINSVDEFIILDDVQFTKRDWRNRNKLKGPAGAFWLSIPVQVKGRYFQKINEAQVAHSDWASHHWKTIESLYARAKCFNAYRDRIRALYTQSDMDHLTDINKSFLRGICDLLGIKTSIPRLAGIHSWRRKDAAAGGSLPAGLRHLLLVRSPVTGLHRGVAVSRCWHRRRLHGLQRLSRVSPVVWVVSARRQHPRSDLQHRRRRRRVLEDDRILPADFLSRIALIIRRPFSGHSSGLLPRLS